VTHIKIEIDTERDGRPHVSATDVRPAALPNVAWISSIQPDPGLISSFTNSLNSLAAANITGPFVSGYSNGTTGLVTTIKTNCGNADLIVTTGGNIAYQAVIDAALSPAKNFISLLGAVPDATPPSHFLGGILLDSYNSNAERRLLLKDKNLDGKQILLYTNTKSSMHSAEKREWPTIFGQLDCTGNNDPTAYQTDFATIAAMQQPTVMAVVISADPFFQSTKADLIVAANAWIGGQAKYVCYPSHGFDITGPTPAAGSIIYGPKLDEAYSFLGRFAAAVLNQNIHKFIGYWPVKDKRKNF